jgi:predicted enzyme related to lactoylglutathione lyase
VRHAEIEEHLMTNHESPRPGTIGWIDLTVGDAGTVRAFYEAVAGWRAEPVEMDGYDDYAMHAPGRAEAVAGVCHARGDNAQMPTQWLIYIVVKDLNASIERCRTHGGEVIGETRGAEGQGRFCVIRDPAGAVCALYEPA